VSKEYKVHIVRRAPYFTGNKTGNFTIDQTKMEDKFKKMHPEFLQ
jgi:hypothetical protein